MARGSSGRVVIEVEPDLKGELYSMLARQGVTLKQWFIEQASEAIKNHNQPTFQFSEPTTSIAREVETQSK